MKSGNVSFDLKRFAGIKRDYSKEDVEKLKGTFKIEHTLCKLLSEKLWNLLNTEPYINTLGSLSGNHAIQHAKAGLKAIYLSGWQVAADRFNQRATAEALGLSYDQLRHALRRHDLLPGGN